LSVDDDRIISCELGADAWASGEGADGDGDAKGGGVAAARGVDVNGVEGSCGCSCWRK